MLPRLFEGDAHQGQECQIPLNKAQRTYLGCCPAQRSKPMAERVIFYTARSLHMPSRDLSPSLM